MGKTSKRVSNHGDSRIAEMGIAGEMATAKLLGCLFNPFPHRGGDGHKGDLWRNGTTISVKTRHQHLPAHILFPPNQIPSRWHDDFYVIGLWDQPYRVLDVVGYATRMDMEQHVTQLPVSGTRSGLVEQRTGFPEWRLRPIDSLISYLTEIEDEEVSTAQTQGYVGYLRDRSRG